QKMDRISTDKCNAASTTATCPEGSETESMCDSADSYDILSPNGSDDDGVPVSDSDEESYQDCLDEDVNDADDSQRNEIKSELAKWAIECGIPRTHISRLLCILRKCKGLSHLPKDYRTLLKTASQGSTKDVQPGYYFHFGLSNGILKSLYHLSFEPSKCNKTCINIDGIPRVFHFAKIFEIQGGLLNWGA
ncbi:Uncharacterized protein APZ42_003312, partial [Daphnia magna]